MKAILILFSGDFLSPSLEADFLETVSTILQKTTNAEGTTVEIHNFDDVDVAKLIAAEGILIAKKPSKITTFDDLLVKFCQEVITRVGDPLNFSNSSDYKVKFVKTFINDADLRHHNTEVIKRLIESGKLTSKYNKILEDHHLIDVVSYLKEINNLVKFF